MGYDMYIIGETPADEQAAVDAAQKARLDAINHRDSLPRGSQDARDAQKQVEAACAELDRVRNDYFRLNCWGMSACRGIMRRAGMLKDGKPDEDWPKFPLADEFADAVYEAYDRKTGADRRSTEDWQRWYGPTGEYPANLTDEQWQLVEQYVTATRRHLTLHDMDTPGIAAHKFGPNDGWIVTPSEIESALKIWDALGDARREEALAEPGAMGWFAEWIDWLRIAGQRGGFAVR